jgi:anti-anti-sigma factor
VALWHRGLESSVICAGDLDAGVAPRLQEAIAMAVETAPVTLRVDCTGVSVVTTAGFDVLAAAKRICRERGIAFELVTADAVARILDALGWDAGGDDLCFPPEVEAAIKRVMSFN